MKFAVFLVTLIWQHQVEILCTCHSNHTYHNANVSLHIVLNGTCAQKMLWPPLAPNADVLYEEHNSSNTLDIVPDYQGISFQAPMQRSSRYEDSG